MRLIANVKMNYGRGRDNRVIDKDEQFETENDRDGLALLRYNRARRPVLTLQRKDLAAEPPVAEPPEGERTKRRYRRRDLQATE